MISEAQFDAIFPLACLWAAEQESIILESGIPLTVAQLSDATSVGVEHATRVRLLKVVTIRPPDDPILKALANSTGLISAGTAGLTLRYGIFIRQDHWLNRRLIVHELVHVMQYERLHGISGFLRPYLTECLYPPGYPNGPLEKEADRVAGEVCQGRV